MQLQINTLLSVHCNKKIFFSLFTLQDLILYLNNTFLNCYYFYNNIEFIKKLSVFNILVLILIFNFF